MRKTKLDRLSVENLNSKLPERFHCRAAVCLIALDGWMNSVRTGTERRFFVSNSGSRDGAPEYPL